MRDTPIRDRAVYLTYPIPALAYAAPYVWSYVNLIVTYATVRTWRMSSKLALGHDVPQPLQTIPRHAVWRTPTPLSYAMPYVADARGNLTYASWRTYSFASISL